MLNLFIPQVCDLFSLAYKEIVVDATVCVSSFWRLQWHSRCEWCLREGQFYISKKTPTMKGQVAVINPASDSLFVTPLLCGPALQHDTTKDLSPVHQNSSLISYNSFTFEPQHFSKTEESLNVKTEAWPYYLVFSLLFDFLSGQLI